ncbi:MAG: hypothetical protein M3Y08_14200 [Fibrobacterota bacterium]|nr:hypothetical protein [Fibrobacterota bacterium]
MTTNLDRKFSAALLIFATASLAMPEFLAKPISPHAALETGQLMHWKYDQTENEYQWVQRFGVWANYQLATADERMKMDMGLGGLLWFSLPEEPSNPATLTPRFLPDISQLSFSWTALGDAQEPSLKLTAGYFPYKYNRDARNLGEYLFRSRSYPSFVYTGGWMTVDRNPGARLMGLMLTNHAFSGKLRSDFILNSELNYPPLYDFSLTYIADLNLGDVLGLGIGANLYHYLPVDKDKSEREVGINPAGAYNAYIVGPGDTAYYTFKAVKLMGKASFDPKPLIGNPAILGSEDLRLFAEVAILGVQNHGSPFDTTNPYNNLYSKMRQRIPIMAGFNLPAFRLLDLVSVQVEYYPFPYREHEFDLVRNTLPIPTLTPGVTLGTEKQPYTRDDWKWSVFLHKQVFNALSISGQVARDHYRTLSFENRIEYFSALTEPKHWYYMVRIDMGI